MLKKVKVCLSVGVSLLPLTTFSAMANSLTKNINHDQDYKIYYLYHNQMFEDKNDLLKRFLLDNPNMINALLMLGDIDDATIDYDQNLLNPNLLSEYDENQIGSVYRLPSGEYTSDFERAKQAEVNEGFKASGLSDGFGNLFDPKTERNLAIDSFRQKIVEGKVGVIDLDLFFEEARGYNPLSERDFAAFQRKLETEIINGSTQISNIDGFTHNWYNESGDVITSFDGIYQGATEELEKSYQISSQKYNEKDKIYSQANGYQGNPHNRLSSDIEGESLFANNPDSMDKYLNKQPAEGLVDLSKEKVVKQETSLVTTNIQQKEELNTFRLDLDEKKEYEAKNRDAFELGKEKQIWANVEDKDAKQFTRKRKTTYENKKFYDSFEKRDFQSGQKFYRSSFQSRFNIYLQGTNDEENDPFDTEMRYDIERWNGKSPTYKKYDYNFGLNKYFKPLNDKNKVIRFNFDLLYAANDITTRIEIAKFNIEEFINWPPNSYDYEYKINNIHIEMKYNQKKKSKNQYWPMAQVVDFKIDISYKYKLNSENEIYFKSGQVFLNNQEIADLEKQTLQDKEKSLKKMINEMNYFQFHEGDWSWQKFNAEDNKRFKVDKLEWQMIIDDGVKKYQIKARIKPNYNLSGSTSDTDWEETIDPITLYLPVEEVDNYDQNIIDFERQQRELSGINFEDVDFNKLLKESGLLKGGKNLVVDDFYKWKDGILEFNYDFFKKVIVPLIKEKNIYILNKKTYQVNGEEFIILEPYLIDFYKIIANKFVELMDDDDLLPEKSNLKIVIDFSNIKLNPNLIVLENWAIKWMLKQEYQEFSSSLIPKPVTFSFEDVAKSAMDEDALYNNLKMIGQQISAGSLQPGDNGIFGWLPDLDYVSYQAKVTETLDYFKEKLFVFRRNDQTGEFQDLIYDLDQKLQYQWTDFFAIIKDRRDQTDEKLNQKLRDDLVKAVENLDYQRFVELIQLAIITKPEDNFQIIAYNYLTTLQKYIFQVNIAGGLPDKDHFTFPDLSKVFLLDPKIQVETKHYLITNQYLFNGSLIATSGSNIINKLYDDDEDGWALMAKEKTQIIDNFDPPLVTKIFDGNGVELTNSDSETYDEVEIVIANAEFVAYPHIVPGYVFDQKTGKIMKFQVSNVYVVTLLDEGQSKKYFVDYDSAKAYLERYMMQFVKIIQRSDHEK